MAKVTHLVLKHKVWFDSGKCMTQIVVKCGGARVDDRLTYDSVMVTCLDCILAPQVQKILHIQLFADGLPIPEVTEKLLASTE